MSKTKLDIDKIGGLKPLNKSEEKLISDFLNKRKKEKQASPKKSVKQRIE